MMTNRHLVLVVIAVFVLLGLGQSAATANARESANLSGVWEYVKVEGLDDGPPTSGWKSCDVPGYLRGAEYEAAWLRREFAVPVGMRGKRIKIRFGGVKYNSRVFVNGQDVGGCFGGYRPFEVDVTAAVRFDQANELVVGLHDWTGVFSPGKIDLSAGRDWDRLRQRPKDKVLSPIGGVYNCYGIWDDVTLVAHDAVYVKDVFIKPSVRRSELVVDFEVANESERDVSIDIGAAVEDGGQTALTFDGKRVDLPAGKSVEVTLRRPWEQPRLWALDDPHLYQLHTTLSSGDELRTRFGFREFWTAGHHFVLNGTRINLLATSWWPPRSPMSRDEIHRRWATVKQMGCVAFRTHTQPWRSVHYDVADEIGLLMIPEGAVWNDDSVYCIDDPVFWDNYAVHLKAMVDRDKNRPSVVMWSLENEFYGGRLNDDAPAKADLVRMGRLVKQWDPTRPILYESDGDPGGVADVIGIHYPHEYPRHTCWPNEADWLGKPQPHWGHQFTNGTPEFFWRKDKPLYVGEFLWLPSADPSWHTVFFGDDAYRDYRRYRSLGKAESWKMQILGYRRHEVAGISPWSVIDGGPLTDENALFRAHQYAYQKLAAYPLDYDNRFYGGREIGRRLEVFNDTAESNSLNLTWELSVNGWIADKGTATVQLGPAAHETVKVKMRLPEIRVRSPAVWRVTLNRDGRTVFNDSHDYALFPKPVARSVAARIGLYDPVGDTVPALQQRKISFVEIENLADVPPDVDIVVIGARTLQTDPQPQLAIGEVPAVREALTAFVEKGGQLLVLRQNVYPKGWFDLTLSEHRSTMTFPLDGNHALVGGLAADDLKFWRGDHLVTDREIVRPLSGGWRAIIVSGSQDGLNHAPLIERRVGRGSILHCQLRLIEKAGKEPAADRLLFNCLDYLARRRLSHRDRAPFRRAKDDSPYRTALWGGDDEYRSFLHGLGLSYDELDPRTLAADLSAYSLIICHGELPDAFDGWRRFLLEGGNLLIHRASPEMLQTLRRTCEIEVDWQPSAGAVVRSDSVSTRFGAIAREDLYWLGEHEGISWATTPRAPQMADSIFGRRIDESAARPFEIEAWQLDGQIVERRGDFVTFATVGAAEADIEFPRSGTYLFGVVGRGTPCDGGWPLARVSVDGKPIGETTLSSRTLQTGTTFGRVEQGRHRVRVEFVNDASNPQTKEDRNLILDRLLVARDDVNDLVFLTSPPAVMTAQRGAGRVVVDQLRWDVERRNARKAARYASALLTALDGDFAPRFGVSVECETMRPQPGMPHFHVFDDHVGQATNGTLSRSVRVARPGTYRLELVAWGTPLDDEYPLVDVHLGARKLGQIRVDSESWRSFPLSCELPAGQHELMLTFTNDSNRPGEGDRNVMYDKVVFYRD